jgi:hypothetical protein
LRKRPAIEIALDLREMPSLAKIIRKRPLPPELTEVLRVAAGSQEVAQEFASKYRRSEAHIREACVFFLQQAVLFPGADSYRTLGLAPGAPPDQIREHRRWLLMWLHPDRNRDKWEVALFDKVVAAANAINGGKPASPARSVGTAGRRRHRNGRSLRPVKRPEPAPRPNISVKPLVLVLLAATAFLLSVAAVVSVLAADLRHGALEDIQMTAFSRVVDMNGFRQGARP